jgi:hypothetical protein
MLLEEYPLMLPALTKLYKDELISSWLVRLSNNHQLKPEALADLLFPQFGIWHRDLDAFIPKELIILLSKMTLTATSDIEDSLISNYLRNLMPTGYTYRDTKWILSMGIVSRRRYNRGLMYCPSCLRKNRRAPYFKKQWRIALNVVCTECNTFLHDRCPNCQAPVIFYRNFLGRGQNMPNRKITQCFHCDFDLQNSKDEYAPNELVSMQLEIDRIIQEGWKKDIFYPHLFFDTLYHVMKLIKTSNSQFELFRHNLNAAKKYPGTKISENHNKSPFNHYNVKERAEMLFYSIWILQDWPKRFIDIAKDSYVLNRSLIKGFKNAPYWYMNMLRTNIPNNI